MFEATGLKDKVRKLLRINLSLMLTCLVLSIGCLALGAYAVKADKAVAQCTKK